MGYALVVVGASLGGLDAMRIILGALPSTFPLPIVLAQHRKPDDDDLLVKLLQEHSALPVVGAVDKQVIMPGRVHVAPPDYHTHIEDDHLSLSVGQPVRFSRPSIDLLFESAAACYRDQVIGLLLSGTNDDGAHGLAVIAAHGGPAIVQDPKSAEAEAMPAAAIRATAEARVLPIWDIGPVLVELATGMSAR